MYGSTVYDVLWKWIIHSNCTEARIAKVIRTVRGHLDSALVGTQKRTTRVVRFVFKTSQKKIQRRDKKCHSAELDMIRTNESVNLVVRDPIFVIG